MGFNELFAGGLSSANAFVIPLLMAIGSFVIIYIIIRVVAYRIKRKILINQGENNEYAEKVGSVVSNIIIYIGQMFNILIVFQILGVNVSWLMAGISFGIGFAMQEILENLIAGFLILTNPMMKIGETKSILGQFNVFGKIESLESRHVIVRLFNRRKLIIPNKEFLNTAIKTHKREQIIRGELSFRLGPKIPIKSLQAAILNEINQHRALITKEQTQVIPEIGSGAIVNFKIFFYINPQAGQSLIKTKSDLMNIVITTLRKYNLKIPYQTKTIEISNT